MVVYLLRYGPKRLYGEEVLIQLMGEVFIPWLNMFRK